MNAEYLHQQFTALYGESGGEIRLFFAPGRVNLIGDHTDYNGGHVFPCALKLGVYAAVRQRGDRQVHAARIRQGSVERGDIYTDRENTDDITDGWLRFPKGIFETMRKRGYEFPFGLDIFYDADIPSDEGLAAVSALEVLTALLIREIYGFQDIKQIDLALIAMNSEDEYLHRPSGIMAPAASALSKEGQGMLLTADSLRCEYVPLQLGNAKLIVAMSGVAHPRDEELVKRRADCERAVKKLKSVVHIENLCDLSRDKFQSCKDVIMNETATKRARHVIYEDARTIRAVSALRVGNVRRMGDLMTESHISLRDDFEVSCPEIDALVDAALSLPYVYGSRMTGKGFGGSTVSLVEAEYAEEFCARVGELYYEKTGLTAQFIADGCGGDGAREIHWG